MVLMKTTHLMVLVFFTFASNVLTYKISSYIFKRNTIVHNTLRF